MENNDAKEIHKIFISHYTDWIKKSGSPKTIVSLSEETGISRQTLHSLLNENKFKMPKKKTIVALAQVWGNELYDELGIEKPAINKNTLRYVWNRLPSNIKEQVSELIEPYL